MLFALILMATTPERAFLAEAAPKTLVFAGSGSNLAVTRVLAKVYMGRHPAIRIEIPASIGSKGGIRAVAEGAIDVGLASRPLKADERRLGLAVRPYARTAVVIGVHPTVEESGITADTLLGILTGHQTQWNNRQEIVVLIREPGDSSIWVLEKGIPGFKEVFQDAWTSRRWIALFSDQKMNRMLAGTPHAIGITDLGSITAGNWAIKPLAFDGVLPSVQNIDSQAYRLTKLLRFVFHGERLPPEAAEFMDFVHSADGKDLLRHNGYAPID